MNHLSARSCPRKLNAWKNADATLIRIRNDLIVDLYAEQGKTIMQIVGITGVPRATIWTVLVKYDITRRPRGRRRTSGRVRKGAR